MKTFIVLVLVALFSVSGTYAAERITPEQMRELYIQGLSAYPDRAPWNPRIICNIRKITIPDDNRLTFTDDNHMVFKVIIVYDEVANGHLTTWEATYFPGFEKKDGTWVFGGNSIASAPRKSERELVYNKLETYPINKKQEIAMKGRTLAGTSFATVYQAAPVKKLPEPKNLLQALANAIGHSEKTFNAILGAGMSARVYDITLNDGTVVMGDSEWLDDERFFVPVRIQYKTIETKDGDTWLGSWLGEYGMVCKNGKNGLYVAGCKPLGHPKGGLSSKSRDGKETFHDKFVKAGVSN
ncbi:MAG: hypothetical protein JW781_10915 [Deltaproteobacteria bacterium]|nr:hypothetical protein [Candidatus Anaeroferrophillacea bacterium]